LKQIAESIESMNQNKSPTKHIGSYAVLEHLGSGAFGSVYKVNFCFDIILGLAGIELIFTGSWEGTQPG